MRTWIHRELACKPAERLRRRLKHKETGHPVRAHAENARRWGRDLFACTHHRHYIQEKEREMKWHLPGFSEVGESDYGPDCTWTHGRDYYYGREIDYDSREIDYDFRRIDDAQKERVGRNGD